MMQSKPRYCDCKDRTRPWLPTAHKRMSYCGYDEQEDWENVQGNCREGKNMVMIGGKDAQQSCFFLIHG
jgi:hypothetical protein